MLALHRGGIGMEVRRWWRQLLLAKKDKEERELVSQNTSLDSTQSLELLDTWFRHLPAEEQREWIQHVLKPHCERDHSESSARILATKTKKLTELYESQYNSEEGKSTRIWIHTYIKNVIFYRNWLRELTQTAKQRQREYEMLQLTRCLIPQISQLAVTLPRCSPSELKESMEPEGSLFEHWISLMSVMGKATTLSVPVHLQAKYGENFELSTTFIGFELVFRGARSNSRFALKASEDWIAPALHPDCSRRRLLLKGRCIELERDTKDPELFNFVEPQASQLTLRGGFCVIRVARSTGDPPLLMGINPNMKVQVPVQLIYLLFELLILQEFPPPILDTISSYYDCWDTGLDPPEGGGSSGEGTFPNSGGEEQPIDAEGRGPPTCSQPSPE